MQAGRDDTAQEQSRLKAGFRSLGVLKNQRQVSAGTIGSRFLELCVPAAACRASLEVTVVLRSIAAKTPVWYLAH
ncbi:MAG: hypothetical protein PVH05_11795 [Burkholderiales bacterium]|jgi:hypothetical protein